MTFVLSFWFSYKIIKDVTSTININLIVIAVLATVHATDDDVASSGVIYKIEGATIFVVDASGQIILSGFLDYEATQEYNLTVTATDQDSPFEETTCQVLITVLDVNDVPPIFLNDSRITIDVEESKS